MQLDFSGKTVLVTGATRGIGAAIADAFEEAGAERLLLTGTRPDQVDALNREQHETGNHRREYIAADFSKRDAVDAFTERLASCDHIDICVNNAGINRLNPIDRIETGDLDDVLDINLRAPFLICRAVSRLMRASGYGRIVNIASMWSVITKPGRSVYTASKFGLAGMTKTLAADLAPDGILVNAVSPGFIQTELSAATLSEAERAALAQEVPLRRFGRPEEIAKVVLFLASDLNTYITGQNIVADGGFVIV